MTSTDAATLTGPELKIYQLEIKSSQKQQRRFSEHQLPGFDFGLEYLPLEQASNLSPEEHINRYVADWFEHPQKYLRVSDDVSPVVTEKDGFLSFDSILNPKERVRFRYAPQPTGTPGRDVALIHIMHWNGRLSGYELPIKLVQKTGLPISTLIHIPAGRGLNPGQGDLADFDMVGPNIGKTIFKARQHIQDIQYVAKYLKEQLGYKEVGLFTYSIGSLYAVLASIMYPKLFDFAILHTVADDFSESVFTGTATTRIAAELKSSIDQKILQYAWSTISPGAYDKYFHELPEHIRIIQAEYDYVFGKENAKRFSEKLLRVRPDTELKTYPVGHTTFGRPPLGAKIMWDNLAFIYRHTKMKGCKRSRLFI